MFWKGVLCSCLSTVSCTCSLEKRKVALSLNFGEVLSECGGERCQRWELAKNKVSRQIAVSRRVKMWCAWLGTRRVQSLPALSLLADAHVLSVLSGTTTVFYEIPCPGGLCLEMSCSTAAFFFLLSILEPKIVGVRSMNDHDLGC